MLEDPPGVLLDWLIEITTFFQALWVVNDNAVCPEVWLFAYTTVPNAAWPVFAGIVRLALTMADGDGAYISVLYRRSHTG